MARRGHPTEQLTGLTLGAISALLLATSLGCRGAPSRAKEVAEALPTPRAIDAELQRRLLSSRLAAILREVEARRDLPTLCRDVSTKGDAIPVSEDVLRALGNPDATQAAGAQANGAPANGALAAGAQANGALANGALAISAPAFRALLAAPPTTERQAEAVARIRSHRYLAVVAIEGYRAPQRRGDRTITKGAMKGRLVLVDEAEGEPLCEATIEARSSTSVNAFGDMSAEAFTEDLHANFLRAVEEQLARATGGMKLAWVSRRRLASRGSSAPSEDRP